MLRMPPRSRIEPRSFVRKQNNCLGDERKQERQGRRAIQARVSDTPISGVFAKFSTFSVTANP